MMRDKFNTTTKVAYKETVKELSEQTRIPISKLVDEALEDLFKKYGKEIKNIEL